MELVQTLLPGYHSASLIARSARRSCCIDTANPKAVRFGRLARVTSARMLIMQEDCKLRSYGFTLRCYRLLKQMILHLLRQVAPYPNNSLA